MKLVRRRYLRVDALLKEGEKEDISIKPLREAVDRVFETLFGATASAKSSLKAWSIAPNRYIFSIDHRYVLELVSALTLTREVGGKRVSLSVSRISGTLKEALGEG